LGKPSKNAAKSVSTSPTLASLTSSVYFPAYEYAKSILDTGAEIDDQLWAKLIKCRILDLKKEVQARTVRKIVCCVCPSFTNERNAFSLGRETDGCRAWQSG
jgi:hypothetical protein